MDLDIYTKITSNTIGKIVFEEKLKIEWKNIKPYLVFWKVIIGEMLKTKMMRCEKLKKLFIFLDSRVKSDMSVDEFVAFYYELMKYPDLSYDMRLIQWLFEDNSRRKIALEKL